MSAAIRGAVGALAALAVCLAPLAACAVGTSPSNFRPALGPAGVRGTLTVHQRRMRVEVLEVRDTALVVRCGARIGFLPLAVIAGGSFDQMEDPLVPVAASLARSPQSREQLRWVSRFPFGMTDAVLAQLLADARQTELEDLGTPRARPCGTTGR